MPNKDNYLIGSALSAKWIWLQKGPSCVSITAHTHTDTKTLSHSLAIILGHTWTNMQTSVGAGSNSHTCACGLKFSQRLFSWFSNWGLALKTKWYHYLAQLCNNTVGISPWITCHSLTYVLLTKASDQQQVRSPLWGSCPLLFLLLGLMSTKVSLPLGQSGGGRLLLSQRCASPVCVYVCVSLFTLTFGRETVAFFSPMRAHYCSFSP